jgi:hypothetical protein
MLPQLRMNKPKEKYFGKANPENWNKGFYGLGFRMEKHSSSKRNLGNLVRQHFKDKLEFQKFNKHHTKQIIFSQLIH